MRKLHAAVLSATYAALLVLVPAGAHANWLEELVSWWQFLTITGFWH